jgi:hypothetical protein
MWRGRFRTLCVLVVATTMMAMAFVAVTPTVVKADGTGG